MAPPLPSMGFILTTLNLDRQSRQYYGNGDTVRGSVVLTYQPPESKSGELGELFGPLVVEVEIEGRLTTAVSEDHGMSYDPSMWFRTTEGRLLWKQTVPLWLAPRRMVPHETVTYPFAFNFPLEPEEMLAPHGSFGASLLPPSVCANISTPSHAGTFRIAYLATAHVDMPGLDVRAASRGMGPHELKYLPSRYPANMVMATEELSHDFTMRSKYLLPDPERPRGLKALFPNYDNLPLFQFSLTLGPFPKSISLDQNLVFELAMYPLHPLASSMRVPETVLKRCKMTLRSLVNVRATPHTKAPMVETGISAQDTILNPQILPEGPFLDPDTGASIVKRVVVPLPKDAGPDVDLDNIHRTHQCVIVVEVIVAKMTLGKQFIHNLSIHTPDYGPITLGEDPAPPPSYDETKHDAGPVEDRPPQYGI